MSVLCSFHTPLCVLVQYDIQHVRRLSKRLVDGITSKLDHVIRNGDPEHTYEGKHTASIYFLVSVPDSLPKGEGGFGTVACYSLLASFPGLPCSLVCVDNRPSPFFAAPLFDIRQHKLKNRKKNG